MEIPKEDQDLLNAYLELSNGHMVIDKDENSITLVFNDGNEATFKGDFSEKMLELIILAIVSYKGQ